jgi:hypothetical protein
MGDISKPDKAISVPVLLEIMRVLEEEWNDPFLQERKRLPLALEWAFYLISFCLALRGEEVPLVDLKGTREYFEAGGAHSRPHVVVSLVGRFKLQLGLHTHIMPMVSKTRSGFAPRKWIGRVIACYESVGVTRGPMFRSTQEQRMKASEMEPKLFERLNAILEGKPHLMPGIEEIEETYGVSRSFRRGATSRATDLGLSSEVINANNRWQKVEAAGASNASLAMQEHYTDVTQTLNQLLRFSENL